MTRLLFQGVEGEIDESHCVVNGKSLGGKPQPSTSPTNVGAPSFRRVPQVSLLRPGKPLTPSRLPGAPGLASEQQTGFGRWVIPKNLQEVPWETWESTDPKLREECGRVPQVSLLRPGKAQTPSRLPGAPGLASETWESTDPKLREECGVVAIHGHKDAAREAYLGLYALQHRGQESAGIATADGQHLANIKGMGLVSEIFTDDILAKLPGTMAIGHTRYSTTGDSALLNAQPIRVDSTKGLIAIAHNGNLVNLGNLRARLEREGAYFQTTSDSEIIVQLIAHSKARTLVDAIADSLSQIDGAFSIVMMTRDRIFAARDPRGFRPLSMARMKNADGPDTILFASETCAFDLLRAEYVRDVLPGELVMVTEDGVTSRQYASGMKQSSCIFEHVYFARPDSRIFGRWVQESRDQMGRQLARESGVAADVVVPVPDSGVTAALGYAEEAGIPFRFGLIRNHYVGRTFIEPEQRVRDFGVRLKLNPVRNLLEGKRVILIDDSIIRGTTSRKIVRMVRGAGATEVHLRISCPPTISPCFYGVDTPSKRDLIAANNTVEEIRQFIEADSLAYLSLDGLLKSCAGPEHTGYCTACYTGIYPTEWVDVDEILPAAATL